MIKVNEERVLADEGNWPSGRNKQRGTLQTGEELQSNQLKEDAKNTELCDGRT